MQAFSREVVLAGDGSGQPGEDDVLAALAPRFTLGSAGRPRTVRRTWLDTFDWRLHRAGLTLEYVTGPRPAELVLAVRGRGDGQAARPADLAGPGPGPAAGPGHRRDPSRGRDPGPAGHRPGGQRGPGPAGPQPGHEDDRLDQGGPDHGEPAGGGRAAGPAPGDRGPRLPAPGRAGRRIAGRRGRAERGTAPPAGRRPRRRRPARRGVQQQDHVRLTPAMPARAALQAVLLQLLDTLEANVPGTIRDIDSEFLHDLRVSVRRTRSALKLAGDVLPASLPARFRPAFKWLGDLTTPTRDLDVYLLNYDEMAGALVSAAPAELEPFHAYLARRRVIEQRTLARGLRSARFSALACEWRGALTGLTAARGGERAADLATRRLRRAHRRVIRQGRAISEGSPAEQLHDLRKRCKELRYLLEIFASLFEPAGLSARAERPQGLAGLPRRVPGSPGAAAGAAGVRRPDDGRPDPARQPRARDRPARHGRTGRGDRPRPAAGPRRVRRAVRRIRQPGQRAPVPGPDRERRPSGGAGR